MKNLGLTDLELQEIVSIFKTKTKIESVSIFGSRATGKFKPGSDIDLAIFGSEIDFDDINEIRRALEEETLVPYFFDVIDCGSVKNPELLEHIIEQGKVIYLRA